MEDKYVNLNNNYEEAKRRFEEAQNKYRAEQNALENAQRSCQHDWNVVADFKHEAGYYIPSDREQGIELGVDSRPGCSVPPQTIPRWRRNCRICGKVEFTERTQAVSQQLPVW